MNYDEWTKPELQEQLREHDLPVTGRKEELIERLEEATDGPSAGDGEEGRAAAAGQSDDAAASGSGDSGRRPRPQEIARMAARQLATLGRSQVEGVAALAREEHGWRVDIEVLEVRRVPSSTDVLGLYAVWVDDDGEMVGYERVERFVRGQPSPRA